MKKGGQSLLLLLCMVFSLMTVPIIAANNEEVADTEAAVHENSEQVETLPGETETVIYDQNTYEDTSDVSAALMNTGGHSQAEALAWVNNQVGKTLGNGQCVYLTYYYYQYLGQTGPQGNGNHYLNGGNFTPNGWNYTNSPQPGDIAVWDAYAYLNPYYRLNQYGHVGIVTNVYGDKFDSVEQNVNGDYCENIKGRYISYVTKFIHPDFVTTRKPLCALDSAEGGNGTVTISGWGFDPDNTDANVDIHVYLFDSAGNAIYIGSTVANSERTDVNAAFGCGNHHGFTRVMLSTNMVGTYEVQIAAIDPIYGGGDYATWSEKKSIIIAKDEVRGSEMSKGYDRELPDGDYVIASAADPGYYLDIAGTAVPAANDTNVAICGPYSGNLPSYEIWTLKYNDGFYTISQKDSTACLDVYCADTKCGQNVQVYSQNGGSAQKWAISKSSSGKGYRIEAKCSGYSLDIENGNISKDINVRQWTDNDSDAQAWVFIPYEPSKSIADGRYVIVNALDESYEIDIPGDTGEVEDRTTVQMWPDSAPSKYNSIDVKYTGDGYYQLNHATSGKSIEIWGADTSNGANVSLFTSNGTVAQQWAIIPNGNGYALIARCSGMAMDVDDTSLKNGVNVSTYYYHGGKAQTWIFKKAEYTVSYNANGGSGAPATQTKYYKNVLSLSGMKPSRSSYTFLGWATSPSSSSVDYAPGASYTLNENATLYAVWKSDTVSYTVKWVSEGKTLKTETVASGTTPSYTGETPTKASDGAYTYTFSGWSPTPSAVQGDVTYTAQFKATAIPQTSAVITAGKATAIPGGTVEIPVSLSKNPGIASLGLTVEYDTNALTLQSIEKGEALSSGTWLPNLKERTITWYNTSNIRADGTLFTLKFSVKSGIAEGSYPVTIGVEDGESGNITDQNSNTVPVQFVSGSIQVSAGIPGDVTGDGKVLMGDVVKIARHVAKLTTLTQSEMTMADVTGDGKVLMGDVVKVARYVAKLEPSLLSRDTDTSVAAVNTRSGSAEAMINVSPVEAKPGEKITVPVTIENNPGIAGGSFQVSYDKSVLTLTEIKRGTVLQSGDFLTNQDIVEWYSVENDKNTTVNGTMFTLEFTVNANAIEGDYPVTVLLLDNEAGNLTNIKSENVDVSFKSGSVRISEAQAAVEIQSVSYQGGTATVKILNPRAGATVYCAGYTAKGQMILLKTQPMAVGQSEYSFSIPNASVVKAYVLDNNMKPICASKQN